MKQLGASGRRARAAVTDGKAGIAYRPMSLLSDDSVCQDGRVRAQDLQLATLSYPTSPPLRGFGPFVVGGVYAERDAFELERDIGMIKRTLIVAGVSAALVLTGAAAFAQTSRTESSLNRTRYLPHERRRETRQQRDGHRLRRACGAPARGGDVRPLRSGHDPGPSAA